MISEQQTGYVNNDTWAKLEALPALYWVTLWTVCLPHFFPLQYVFLSFGTLTISTIARKNKLNISNVNRVSCPMTALNLLSGAELALTYCFKPVCGHPKAFRFSCECKFCITRVCEIRIFYVVSKFSCYLLSLKSSTFSSSFARF